MESGSPRYSLDGTGSLSRGRTTTIPRFAYARDLLNAGSLRGHGDSHSRRTEVRWVRSIVVVIMLRLSVQISQSPPVNQ